MAIKKYKPTSPARRQMTVSTFEEITKKTPERSLLEPLKSNAGRNSYGRITVRHRGGGTKRKYRVIDFKRDKRDMKATVLAIEYDPNRSANNRRCAFRQDAFCSSFQENTICLCSPRLRRRAERPIRLQRFP